MMSSTVSKRITATTMVVMIIVGNPSLCILIALFEAPKLRIAPMLLTRDYSTIPFFIFKIQFIVSLPYGSSVNRTASADAKIFQRVSHLWL